MTSDRRQFIKAGVLGSAALASGVVPGFAIAGAHRTSGKSMQILVLGGTGFIGPHMVREALRRGHNVTLFNRGRTNSNLFPDLELIRGDRAGELAGLKGRRFDAVVDNSGYVPRYVQNSARTLAGNVGHYLFISTLSVYASFASANDEDSELGRLADESVEEVTGETYGPLKALCERRVHEEIGQDRATVLRPGYICGPGDHTDRFTYWPVRTSRGGEMLWPGSAAHTIQIIDVRDLANFVVDSLEQRTVGTYNMVIPPGTYTLGNLLEDSQAVSGVTVDPVWADDAFVASASSNLQTQNWGAFPIWHPTQGEYAGASSFSNARALEAGLHNRPVRETIRDLLAWWETLPEARKATMRAGISGEQEANLIQQLRSG